ncbi:hypothetical protein VT84_23690 [Gemmata sp. SH-PL17]|uniref:hypothetical protein n=1 Tax=Gemmata sp. SH-PL17 TaxID=1630693 RepID=UPI00078E42AD|nr:hypothetical protein [Gemmata sp. SH-PL17]AMV27423.1 hypothetical protein VT84_23690 [Gemmata sp. SH-PL17]
MSVVAWVVCASGLLPGQPDAALEKEFEALSKLPTLRKGEHRCETWVAAANHLRQMGKEKSLKVLNAYLARSADHERVLLICRLLFVNPKGWEAKLGGPRPPNIDRQAVKNYPLFPFAVSEGTPFVLVKGYAPGGKIGGGKQCLETCADLELIKEDYSTKDWDKAAHKLIKSEHFLKLYPECDRQEMADFIRDQAKKTAKKDE